MSKKRMKKKGQIAIFVILGIAIVLVIILLLIDSKKLSASQTEKPALEQIRECVQKETNAVKESLMIQGGTFEPENYYMHEDEKIRYLCYTEEYYKKCIMQVPFLKQNIEEELSGYLEPKLQNCLKNVKENLENNGYTVSMTKPITTVRLIPNSISIEIDTDLRLTKGATITYDNIQTDVDSKIYQMIIFAGSISNWEARYGDSEIVPYMSYYPWVRVEKRKQIEGTTLYTLTNKDNGEQFKFAVRSVANPPGITGR